MSFYRKTPSLLEGEELDRALRALGFRLGARNSKSDTVRAARCIEQTLVSASDQGLARSNYRLLGVLVAWLEQHKRRVLVPKLRRMLLVRRDQELLLAFWATMARWLEVEDNRWKTISDLYQGPPMDLDPVGTDIQLRRRGEETRFTLGPLRVYQGLLRPRAADVDPPQKVAAQHPIYRQRVHAGTSYRADAWAALERQPSLSTSGLAQLIGCAYNTAKQVKADWELLASAQ